MKKTLLSLLLAITMLVLLAVPTFAVGGNLSAVATPSADGTSFTIDLIVNDNPGIIALTGKVTYDNKVVKLTSAKSGVIFENPFMTSQTLEVNPYQIIWMDATARKNNVTNGVLATYTFEVLENAPNGESKIKFEIAEAVNRDKGDVTFTPCSFIINVKGTQCKEHIYSNQCDDTCNICNKKRIVPDHIYGNDLICDECGHRDFILGDIDSSNVVDLNDVYYLSRYIAGWKIEINNSALDVNKDYSVNLKDLSLLAQYVAGWDVILN